MSLHTAIILCMGVVPWIVLALLGWHASGQRRDKPCGPGKGYGRFDLGLFQRRSNRARTPPRSYP